eukprot:COSAG05_NODE_7493_length_806_cov_1.519149_1_plen_122_part_00
MCVWHIDWVGVVAVVVVVVAVCMVAVAVADLADIIPKYRVQEKEKQKDGQWYQDVEIFAGGATHSIGNIINEDGLVRLSMDGKSKVVAVLDASLFQDQVTKICTHRFKMEQGRLVALHPGK